MSVTCTAANAAATIFTCNGLVGIGEWLQPIATVLTGALAIGAAGTALRGARTQAEGARQAAQLQANAALESQRLNIEAADRRLEADRSQRYRAIRQQLSALVYTATAAMLFVMNDKPFPEASKEYLSFLRRVADRLNDLETAAALDTDQLSSVIKLAANLEASIISFNRNWQAVPESRTPDLEKKIQKVAYLTAMELREIAVALNDEHTVAFVDHNLAIHPELVAELQHLLDTTNESGDVTTK